MSNRRILIILGVILVALAVVCAGIGVAVLFFSTATGVFTSPVPAVVQPPQQQTEPPNTQQNPPQSPNVPPAQPQPTRPAQGNPPAPGSSGGGTPGVLILPGGEPPTLDPALAQDSTSAAYIVEIYSGLVSLDQNLEVVPDLATKWEISDDGKTYTFHLRDAKFSNGKVVNADAFKYAIERACDPATASVVADSYLGDIVGARAKLRGQAKDVSGIKVVDDKTLQITIDAPKAYFLAKLTYPTAFALDQQSVQSGGKTWASNPKTAIGTGAFKLAQYELGQSIVLQANDQYYGTPKPALKEVHYMLSGGSAMTMYQTGELDATPVGLNDIDAVLDPNNPLNKELHAVEPTMSLFYIGFDVKKPPFDDLNVRQAFNYAIDKQKILDVVLHKTQLPAKGILPPGMPGYNPNLDPYPFDPAKAKQLLAQSKYANNMPDITISVSGAGGTAAGSVEAIVEMYKQNLGVDVQIEQLEWATYLNDLKGHRFQMFGVTAGWIADYPDPQDFLDILFHSASRDNNFNYANPQVDQLLEQARTERDQTKRFDLYHKAEDTILQDAPLVPLGHDVEYWLVKPYVQNMPFPPMIIPKLKYVTVAK
ncbi:MAG: peptide ABC transporter substrate-binding protein [Chloroflexi bacterium]|nr:peptide ABC transporter substrate-binding protein [Chloroflexota bacterium]